LTEGLCGGSRAGHFRGVVTVCAKLFNIVGADKAFFGQKDAQQVVVIKKMVRDLNIPVEIIVCPIVREQDGLAMSSRNKYLNPAEREQAVLLSRSLERCSELFKGGEKRVSMLKDEMRKILGEGKDIEPEYIEMVDSENLEAVEEAKQGVLVAIAARVGGTRLIDNIILA